MNWTLVISALEKHVRMSQAAVDFARQHRKGQLFSEAMTVLSEAQYALEQCRTELLRRRVKREEVYSPNPQNFRNRVPVTEVYDAPDYELRGMPVQPESRKEDDAAGVGVTLDNVDIPDASGGGSGAP